MLNAFTDMVGVWHTDVIIMFQREVIKPALLKVKILRANVAFEDYTASCSFYTMVTMKGLTPFKWNGSV